MNPRQIIAFPLDLIRFIYHLPTLLQLIRRLLSDPRIPIRIKLIPYCGILYFILPLDLLKDFPLVYLGFIDDVIVLVLCLRLFLRRCPKEVVEEHIKQLSHRRSDQR
jgi:uncharacterized membrane protein YkvA (DUF1232 family)